MMIDRREARYPWGQDVLATVDLYNDGSLPDVPEDQLLVVRGGPGEIVQVGHHTEANIPLYMVDFGVCVLGCLEEEIVRAADGLPPELPPEPPQQPERPDDAPAAALSSAAAPADPGVAVS
ncbi:nitrogen fixation protein NifZ [Pseudaquabacterium rugosum]|uniref:Nitrogen fixation protein NifZ n=1 Tax=Pseudaquabacterium rugosum TaxID=2984194 RepID=A0ABU9BCS0_9BURK